MGYWVGWNHGWVEGCVRRGNGVLITQFSSTAGGTHEVGEVRVGGAIYITVDGGIIPRYPVALGGGGTATRKRKLLY